MLTLTGAAVGLIVWLMPGHAGVNPATIGLMHPPGPLLEVPSLLLAAVLGLGRRGQPRPGVPCPRRQRRPRRRGGRPPDPPGTGGQLGRPGHVGHHRRLFGAPIAAALMLTELFVQAPGEESLWDRISRRSPQPRQAA